MRRTHLRMLGTTTLLAMAAAMMSGHAAATKLGFIGATRLPNWSGGEPSIAFDPSGLQVYIVAPQNIPSVVNKPAQALSTTQDQLYRSVPDTPVTTNEYVSPPTAPVAFGDRGVGFWASVDGGRSWSRSANIGSSAGGGDSDVVVGSDHTLYVADLEAVAASICTSTNRGASFTSAGVPADTCQTVTGNQQGPANDREWLTTGRSGELYLTYHDFEFGYPIVLKSTDKAKTFAPCGAVLDPQGPAGANYSPLSGTLVAKPVVWRDNSIFTTVSMPDRASNPVGGPIDHIYLAAARGGCGPTTVWKNYKVYENPGADFSLFQSLTMDGGGVMYVIAAGKTAANQATSNIWLFASRDMGAHWSAPIRVNPPSLRANVLPAITGGFRANQLAIGWYGTTTNGDPNFTRNQWRYYVSTSFDAGRTYQVATVTPGIIHYGDICTDGLFCIDGNRNLADFSSIAVQPGSGCVTATFAGDPWNRPDLDVARDSFISAAYVTHQTSGACLR